MFIENVGGVLGDAVADLFSVIPDIFDFIEEAFVEESLTDMATELGFCNEHSEFLEYLFLFIYLKSFRNVSVRERR